ncbi:MAG: penicillin-binding protein 2 [Gammaproteobacteria bacterium]
MVRLPPLKNYLAESHVFTKRVWLAFCVVLILLVVLIGRLVYLQIFQHDVYTTLSNQNQLNLIPIDPNRGLIYDRNGVLLAENVPVFSLDVIPDQVPHFEATLKQLEQIIDISPDDLQQFRKLLRQRRSAEGVPLKMNLREDEVATFYLNQYRFPGFGVTGRLLRFYPQGDTMVSALGYVGRINEQELAQVDPVNYAATDYIGKLGVEKYYESVLHGKVGYQQVETDANGQVVRVLNQIPPVAGKNLYLSLDSKLQKVAEDALGEDQGSVVVIKPATGEVLAFVSNPRYEPNVFVKGIPASDYKALQQDPQRPLYNRALRGLYPSGSIMKPFLALEYLDSGVVKTTDKIHDPGWFALPGQSHVYKDWRKGGHGVVDMHKAIVQSCDTYFYTMAVRAGIGRMNTIQYAFGMGKPTGLDVSDELGGVVPSPAWKRKALGQGWYTGDTVNAGIGQGFTMVTPLQMAHAVATLSERGMGFKPHFLLKWQNGDGKFDFYKPVPVPVTLHDPGIWDFVINAMHGVTSEAGGTARAIGAASYTIGGKTGTAQVYRPKAYGDDDNDAIPKKYRSHAWFIAFAPINSPQIALAVIVENHPHQGPVVARKVLDYYLLPNHGQVPIDPATAATATPDNMVTDLLRETTHNATQTPMPTTMDSDSDH